MKIKLTLALFLSMAFATLTKSHDFGYTLPAKCSFQYTEGDFAEFWLNSVIGPIPENQNYDYWGPDYTKSDCEPRTTGFECLTQVSTTIEIETLEGDLIEKSTQLFVKRIGNRVQASKFDGGIFTFWFENANAAEVLGPNPKIVSCYIQ